MKQRATKYIYTTTNSDQGKFAFGALDTDPRQHAYGTLAGLIDIAYKEGYYTPRLRESLLQKGADALPCAFTYARGQDDG